MTATLARIRTYPVKGLDPRDHETIEIAERGALAGDRAYAIVGKPAEEPHDVETASVGAAGDYFNGKRSDAVHRLRSTVDPEERTLALRVHGERESETFDLDDRAELNRWLSDYFGREVSVRHEPAGGHPDSRVTSGPTVISTATLEAVSSWFPDIGVEEMRRRFRASLELGGVPPFWEDRLYADRGEVVAFEVGDVRFEGIKPCARCVVPTRNPDTGEADPDFRETFIERRRETRPKWLDSDRYDHNYRLMVNTQVPEPGWGETLSVGDEVRVLGVESVE